MLEVIQMIYVISDIHGEYEAYKKLLKTINFSEQDELFVLGDCIDRGSEPIKVLQDMMLRANVYPIIGNHEYMALKVLKQLMREITEENCESISNSNLMQELLLWQQDGGNVTLEQFQKLSDEERYDILEYLEEFSPYEEIEINNIQYVLVHAGLDNFSDEKDLSSYELYELIFNSPDYNKMYYKDKYLVTGHLPTISIEGNDGEVIIKNNHIAIDCGKVFGGKLAAVCLDTMDMFYV